MALPYSRELLAGALLSKSLSADGDAEELHTRLGAALVKELLTPKRGSKRTVDATSTAAPKRSKSEWHAFMKSERPRVVASGVTGRAAVIKEIARRWALWKHVGTSSQPLALMAPTSDSESDGSAPPEGLLEALKDLDESEVNAALAAHGLPVDGDSHAKVHALATAMVA